MPLQDDVLYIEYVSYAYIYNKLKPVCIGQFLWQSASREEPLISVALWKTSDVSRGIVIEGEESCTQALVLAWAKKLVPVI